jgi:hypothetical protein
MSDDTKPATLADVKRVSGDAVSGAIEERFWLKVNKSGPVVRDDLGPCWVWTGRTRNTGYGGFGRSWLAHRFAWELTNAPIADGLCVLHRCDNPPCVNPAHLFLGTQADNNRDCGAKGRNNTVGKSRMTHCLKGHEYGNERRGRDGGRACVPCLQSLRLRRIQRERLRNAR